MPDLFDFSANMEDYFRTLPREVQETMLHSSLKFGCTEDLRQCAKNLLRGERTELEENV